MFDQTRIFNPFPGFLGVVSLLLLILAGPAVCLGAGVPQGLRVDQDRIAAALAGTGVQGVALEAAARIADNHAGRVFGAKAVRGQPILIHDGQGRPYSYVIPYALNAVQCPSHDQILAAVRTARKGLTGAERRSAGRLTQGLGPMGCVEVAATRSSFPVLVVRKSLHPFFLYYEEALEKAREILGSPGATLESMEFSGPHELYFNFSSPSGKLSLQAYTLLPKVEFHNLGGISGQAEQVNGSRSPAIAQRLEQAWAEAEGLRAVNREDAFEWIPHYPLLPVVQWTHWCVPTAWSMVAGYWDHYDPDVGSWTGFGRVIDYWFDHPAICQNNNVTNVPNLIDEMIVHTGNCSWAQGGLQAALNTLNQYNFTITDLTGTQGNDWCWGDIVAEVRKGRPSVWGVGPVRGHAMAAWGYRIVGSQKFVLVYDTWGATAEDQTAEYSYDEWEGAANTQTGVGLLEPGGGTGENHAILHHPRGEETVFGSTEISWHVFGNQIAWTLIYFSSDGGATWSIIHDEWFLPTTPGWNTYQANLNTATTRGRIRIECFSEELDYIAGDGSYHNFFVQGKPDLVPIATCKRDEQGRLLVRVKNQGTVATAASMTRVTYYPGGVVDVSFPGIAPGDTAEEAVEMPGACWNPDCDYEITVDLYGLTDESDENNNTASGACIS